jgi:hypothetical protein
MARSRSFSSHRRGHRGPVPRRCRAGRAHVRLVALGWPLWLTALARGCPALVPRHSMLLSRLPVPLRRCCPVTTLHANSLPHRPLPLSSCHHPALACCCTALHLWLPGRCARGAGPPSPCHLWHYDTRATLTSCVCHWLAPAVGRTGCASRIAPRSTRQLPTTSSPPPVLCFSPARLCAPDRMPGHRHSPSIPRARVCAWMSVCQPYPPLFELSHDELQFGSSPSAVPLR